MITKNDFISLLHKLQSEDKFVNDLFTSVGFVVNKALDAITAIKNEMYFDTMVYLVPYYEKIMQISPRADQTLTDRRSQIKARWLSRGHNSITLLQNVLNSWLNGETTAEFINGKIKITFHSIYGIPTDFQAVLDTLNVIKPAHIGYLLAYKYLLKRDIHNVMTKNEMQTKTKNMFASGRG